MQVEIAILDSGIDAAAFEQEDIREPWVDRAPGDRTGHGTACARRILEAVPEEVPRVVFTLPVLDEANRCRPSDLLKALEWCIENEMDVANVSLSILGAEYFYEFEEVTRRAAESGLVVVAAADSGGRLSWPALSSHALGVGVAISSRTDELYFDESSPIECFAQGDSSGEAPGDLASTSFATARFTGRIVRWLGESRAPRDPSRLESLKKALSAELRAPGEGRILTPIPSFDRERRASPVQVVSRLRQLLESRRSALAVVSAAEARLLVSGRVPLDLVETISPPSYLSRISGLTHSKGPSEDGLPVSPGSAIPFSESDLHARLREAEVETWVIGSLPETWRRVVEDLEAWAEEQGTVILHLCPRVDPESRLSRAEWSPGRDQQMLATVEKIADEHIFRSQIPTLALVSAGARPAAAFQAELLLARHLRLQGIEIQHFGSHPSAEIFGATASLHSSRLGNQGHPGFRVGWARALVESAHFCERPVDLILAGISDPLPEHLMAETFFPDFGLTPLCFLAGCQPDSLGLVVDEMVAPSDLRRTLRALESWMNSGCSFVAGIRAGRLLGIDRPAVARWKGLGRVAKEEGVAFFRLNSTGIEALGAMVLDQHGLRGFPIEGSRSVQLAGAALTG